MTTMTNIRYTNRCTKHKAPFARLVRIFKNTVIFFWWLGQVTKEHLVNLWDRHILPWVAGFYYLGKDRFAPWVKRNWEMKILPVLALVELILSWLIIHLMAFIWILTPFYWYLGNKGTVKLIEKIEHVAKARKEKKEESTWGFKFRPVGAIAVATCFALLFGILTYPNGKDSSIPTFPATVGGTDVEIVDPVTEFGKGDTNSSSFEQEAPHEVAPTPASVFDAWYYIYDFSEVEYDENLMSKAERDYCILCVQHECGHSGSLFEDYCEDYGRVQRALAKSFLNQRKNLGYKTLQETISNEIIFGSLKSEIDAIYAILSNGGDTEDLRAAGIANPELYDLYDKTTLNNVNTVVYGLDDIPDNALFWRNDDGETVEDAWNVFLSYYSEEADLTRYLSVKVASSDEVLHPYGYYWLLFAQDNNFQP